MLEKEQDIVADPRGVVLTGDALRSLWKLGIGKRVASIGHGKYKHRQLHDKQAKLRPLNTELRAINFHQTSFQNQPFLAFDFDNDMMEHALPSTILQSQPRLG